MTAYVVFSALQQERIKIDQVVPVSNRSWRMVGSRMFIEPNKQVTVDELIHGVIVQSGNDACVALAELIAGSEDLFVHMMNEEAKRLGMHNTHFTNSTGLTHSDHYSTAHDLALLAAAIIRDFQNAIRSIPCVNILTMALPSKTAIVSCGRIPMSMA